MKTLLLSIVLAFSASTFGYYACNATAQDISSCLKSRMRIELYNPQRPGSYLFEASYFPVNSGPNCEDTDQRPSFRTEGKIVNSAAGFDLVGANGPYRNAYIEVERFSIGEMQIPRTLVYNIAGSKIRVALDCQGQDPNGSRCDRPNFQHGCVSNNQQM